MPSERIQRQIDRLLDESEHSLAAQDWTSLANLARQVLLLDAGNGDAQLFLTTAGAMLTTAGAPTSRPTEAGDAAQPPAPSAFADGRYTVKRFLGEGGKKRVYLAHDTLLDRDVAFALIKTEGLDDAGRDRITREAQAMGRLGTHPHIVSVFDLGEEAGQPCIVTELMGGGDVESLIEKAPQHRPPLERTLAIAIQVCDGLEFAHSHGIVHRDLKPGNVWLTSALTPNPSPNARRGEDGTSSPRPLGEGQGEGVAKLGDFGLAISLDRSRLTQAGMMVGTVSYMPPEQATGGEVTPLSDLYSLGAMLYEMVTGRPPFVGDESVAIIGQHLNTPPVAPSWHNPSVPPGLEALILRLLEKEPGKRPVSAREVQTAIEHILRQAEDERTAGAIHRAPTPGEPRAGSSPSPHAGEGRVRGEAESDGESQAAAASARPLGDNPLYRRVFVGREQEVRQLQAAFDAALSGKGALAMVVGEPGIGKTAVCEQLATYATLRGGTTLTGHCYEEGSLSLPYLAFVEALGSYVHARPPEVLRQELGSAASDLARIVSEVRERLAVEPRPPSEPEEDRWRLLQAVSGFLRNASAVHPLLLVLEDLHWADQGTLDLLQHLARNLSGARILVIGTYRDVEVDRSHPLSATLAELRRGAEFGRVLLRGLGTPEVQRMLVAITGTGVPGSLAESIHRQTEGNPLFVQEVVRYLVEEGHLGHGGAAAAGTPATMTIPEGLRDVIGRRLSRLSPECNRLLAVAAVIGREFGLETLESVAGLVEEAVVSALEEALHVGVLEEQSRLGVIRYRFAHAFFRQTLYEETIAPRRIRLHQQVARALEAVYGRRLEEHAVELAEHYAYSSDPSDLAKAVEYGELAAHRALSVYAYGEAVRHLEQALKVQEVLDPDDKAKRCDLLLALGSAMLPTGEPGRVCRVLAVEAVELAEGLRDGDRASRACRLALDALNQLGSALVWSSREWIVWSERADRQATARDAERVYADLALSNREFIIGNVQRAWELSQGALELARQLDAPEVLFAAASRQLFGARCAPVHEPARLQLAREFGARSRTGVSARTLRTLLAGCATTLLLWGDRPRAEELLSEGADLAERTQDVLLSLMGASSDMVLATLDGRFEAASAAAAQVVARADALGAPAFGQNLAVLGEARPLLYLGRGAAVIASIPAAAQSAGLARETLLQRVIRALCLAHLGRLGEAKVELQILLVQTHVADENQTITPTLSMLLETAILVGDVEVARLLVPRLSPVAAMLTPLNGTVLARQLGAAAALFGQREQARAYYEQALEVAGKVRFRPEIALTRLQIAELMLEDAGEAERTEALSHLDFAVAEFREMKMQPSLERALRHKEVLKA